MNSLLILALQVPCVIFALTLHEFTRAAVSTLLGDQRPKNDGRLTINPVKHFEPIGFMLAFITGFGWGQPVQTSALYYKNRKRDTLITAIAPTVANIVAAAIFGILLRVVGYTNSIVFSLLLVLVRTNVSLAVYNIVPITPMDGLKVLSILMPANNYFKYLQYEKMVQMIFLLALFMGYTGIIFSPIINALVGVFAG